MTYVTWRRSSPWLALQRTISLVVGGDGWRSGRGCADFKPPCLSRPPPENAPHSRTPRLPQASQWPWQRKYCFSCLIPPLTLLWPIKSLDLYEISPMARWDQGRTPLQLIIDVEPVHTTSTHADVSIYSHGSLPLFFHPPPFLSLTHSPSTVHWCRSPSFLQPHNR